MNLNSALLKQNIIFLLVFFHFCCLFTFGQTENECYKLRIKDTSSSTLNSIYFKLIKKGYLIPNSTIINDNNDLYLNICPGQSFRGLIIESQNSNAERYKPKEIAIILETKYQHYINNGFPFASLKLDSIRFKQNTIYCNLKLQKGPYFEWGDLFIKGTSTVNDQIIRNIINIKTNEPYSDENFINIENKLSQLPYLSVFQKPELLFENGKANLYLYLNSKKINNISGTIGLQQNTISQKYFLIGDLKMKLVNQLKKGEGIDFQWRRIQESTQSLKLGLNYPSLFKSNFGIDNQFNLYKKDSTFLELKNQFGIQYFTTKGFIIKANYKYIESNILNTDLNSSTIGRSLNHFYGLSFIKQKIDYLPAPKNGFQFLLDVSLGRRSTSRNDSLNLKFDNTLKSEYQLTHYFSIFKRNIIKTQISGEIYLAPYYYQNEMLRFGGLLNQRGFREDELLGNIRFTQSFEYRFMIEQNSYLFAFYDLSYYENQVKNKLKDTPYGFGTGISFGTNQGIFSISYAIGSQKNNPLLLRNGIIHFGYISYF
jgi:hypothetical protein